jgi:hypothetical protein
MRWRDERGPAEPADNDDGPGNAGPAQDPGIQPGAFDQ